MLVLIVFFKIVLGEFLVIRLGGLRFSRSPDFEILLFCSAIPRCFSQELSNAVEQKNFQLNSNEKAE